MAKKNRMVYLLIFAILFTNGCRCWESESISDNEYVGGYEVVEYTSDEDTLILISDLFGGGEEYLYKKAKWGEEVRIGPTQYGICGFIKYSEDEFLKFLSYSDYYAKKPFFPDGISEKDISNEELDWNYSSQLNKTINGSKYIGTTLVNFSNRIVFFEISR